MAAVEELDPEISHFVFPVLRLVASAGMTTTSCLLPVESVALRLGLAFHQHVADLEPISIEPEALELLKAAEQQPQTPSVAGLW